MYIEKIIIEGFRNGSGKSSFFEAIQFVLCEEYHKLSPEERSSFLHEGTSSRVPSCFVELIFNNSDKQFPGESTEKITIRRTIGPKQDQFLLNKKRISKEEILRLFPTAGLSTRNPYYIIKQRELLEIVTGTDEMRLDQLKEIAGISLFETRYQEMKTLLHPIMTYLSRDDLFDNVNRCLRQKEAEEQDMKQYAELKKQRRLLEFLLSEMELKKFTSLLTKAQRRYSEQSTELIDVKQDLNSVEEEISKLVSKINATKKEIDLVKFNFRELITKREKFLINVKNWKVNIERLVENISKDEEAQEEIKDELEKLIESIDKFNDDLIPIKKEYEAKEAEEKKITHDLAVAEKLQKELILKKHRKKLFENKEERDDWIKEHLQLLDEKIKESDQYRAQYENELEVEKSKKRDLENKIQELEDFFKSRLTSIINSERTLDERKNERIQYQKQRKDLFEKKSIFESELNDLNHELKKADQALGVNKDIIFGLYSVFKVLDTFRQQDREEVEENYHGMVVDNFSAIEDLNTAIEMTAGTRLFYNIVETDEFGMKILEEMNEQKLPGVVNFLAINRLNFKEQNYPDDDDDARPLIYSLQYEDKFDAVISSIFGRTLVCKNLECASNAVDRYKLNCITLSGAKISKSGDVAGGHKKNYKSMIAAYRTRVKILGKIRRAEGKLKRIDDEFKRVEEESNKNLTEINKLEVKLIKANDIQKNVREEIERLKEQQRDIEGKCEETEKILNDFVTVLEIVRGNKEHLESELQQDLLSQLTDEDQRQFEEVNDLIVQLSCKKKKLVDDLIDLSNEKDRLEEFVKKGLLKKKKLEERLQELEVGVEKFKVELRRTKEEIKEIKSKIDEINERIDEDKITDLVRIKINLEEKLKKRVGRKEEILEIFRALKCSVEELEAKIKNYEEEISVQKEKLKIMDPMTRHRNAHLSFRELNERLREVNASLKSLENINIDVLRQFEMVTEFSEEFKATHEKLIQYVEEARKLLQLVRESKTEITCTTFREMNKHFNKIFKKLVPGGSAKLILKIDGEKDKYFEDITVEIIEAGDLIGVDMEVSFNESAEEQQVLEQFSSGQKSLVALAFILAAQKCHFTPFYVLDESDYALDPEHRKNFAKLIASLSNKIQFISTTFRPEQLEYANEFFGVQIRNKVSYLQRISKKEAAAFVED
ncbi:Similar to smc3: Structural maintenance of chromosomes protein 3 (Xenopus laevis) [Cotesia congregata]|uniref:Structural maintenance of chromosomes protein n=1 Tax=Cotesia congregata TaxID=51543 RepID=A0A8J2H867_COTCN|nr:Similar to smc3: Structural maintenance of chromosomes protein 3 (Xenopus laevis) [Cotesia congregata]